MPVWNEFEHMRQYHGINAFRAKGQGPGVGLNESWEAARPLFVDENVITNEIGVYVPAFRSESANLQGLLPVSEFQI
jgi:hypothetical protein